MSFLITYWKQVTILFILLFVFGFGYYRGYSNQKTKFDAFKMQVEINAKIQKQKNEILVQKQKEISENITKEYADAVKKLNNYYAKHPNIKWMQHSGSTSNRVSEESKSTSTVDGKTESNLSSASRNAALDCASDVLQLLYLQDWIKQQKLIEQ